MNVPESIYATAGVKGNSSGSKNGVIGGYEPDGITVILNEDNKLSVPTANEENKGIIKISDEILEENSFSCIKFDPETGKLTSQNSYWSSSVTFKNKATEILDSDRLYNNIATCRISGDSGISNFTLSVSNESQRNSIINLWVMVFGTKTNNIKTLNLSDVIWTDGSASNTITIPKDTPLGTMYALIRLMIYGSTTIAERVWVKG